MKTYSYSRARHGFTLVELLVVISIIIVLAAVGFTAITKVIANKNKVVTQASISDLSLALTQFYDSYSRLPDVGGQDELTVDGPAGVELLKILTGKEDPGGVIQNPKGIVFLTTKISDNRKKGGMVYSGSQAEGVYDAWGRALHIRFDNDSDNEIPNPFKQGEVVRQKKAIIWSFGADGKVGDNDDVGSW